MYQYKMTMKVTFPHRSGRCFMVFNVVWKNIKKGVLIMSDEKQLPALKKFKEMSQEIFKDGEISYKQKELIAIGISVQTRCEPCIYRHVEGAVEAGASRQEILEAAQVAVAMGGGPSMAYINSALYKALDESI